jgi:hypothetical protein
LTVDHAAARRSHAASMMLFMVRQSARVVVALGRAWLRCLLVVMLARSLFSNHCAPS